jgi:hypothetical protein
MGTDITGFIEVRRPSAGPEWLQFAPLYPLYTDDDYLAFGCLFGVRNRVGWEPVAPRRGLPADVSPEIRARYDDDAAVDEAVGDSTWVSWPELRDLDMSVRPEAAGVLEVQETPSSPSRRRSPPLDRAQIGDLSFPVRPLSRLDVLGPGTGWEHVFAVMRALAQRFGDDDVRLVVWFVH